MGRTRISIDEIAPEERNIYTEPGSAIMLTILGRAEDLTLCCVYCRRALCAECQLCHEPTCRCYAMPDVDCPVRIAEPTRDWPLLPQVPER